MSLGARNHYLFLPKLLEKFPGGGSFRGERENGFTNKHATQRSFDINADWLKFSAAGLEDDLIFSGALSQSRCVNLLQIGNLCSNEDGLAAPTPCRWLVAP